MHVEQVLGDVPKAERCRCREEAKEAKKQAREPSPRDWIKSFFPR
jgi:GTP cyclohydrolase II